MQNLNIIFCSCSPPFLQPGVIIFSNSHIIKRKCIFEKNNIVINFPNVFFIHFSRVNVHLCDVSFKLRKGYVLIRSLGTKTFPFSDVSNVHSLHYYMVTQQRGVLIMRFNPKCYPQKAYVFSKFHLLWNLRQKIWFFLYVALWFSHVAMLFLMFSSVL